MAPKPPHVRHAPGNPGRSSVLRVLSGAQIETATPQGELPPHFRANFPAFGAARLSRAAP